MDTCIRTLHRCRSLNVVRVGPYDKTGPDVLEDSDAPVQMVAVLRDFDVLLLKRFPDDAIKALEPWYDGVEVLEGEPSGRAGRACTARLTGHGCTREVSIIFTGASEDEAAVDPSSVHYPFVVLRRREFLAAKCAKHSRVPGSPPVLAATRASLERSLVARPSFS